jgi:2-methylcitrate dehydratase PrpD
VTTAHRPAVEPELAGNSTQRLARQLALMTPTAGAMDPRLRDLLVDALGVALAGRDEPVSVAAASLAAGSTAAWDRAWLHGVHMHALDFDDTHERSLCHTAVALLPGLIALAVDRRLPAQRLFDAYLLGLRVVDFLAPVGPRFNEMGLHSTGLVGTLAAAAASSWLLDGDSDTGAAAMEFAALTAAGLGAAFGTEAKPIQAARAAEAGLRAALFAAHRVGPPHGAVMGRRGLVALWLGEDAVESLPWGTPRPEAVAQVAMKPYPSCFLTHSTIDAILAIREELQIRDESAVVAVEVTAHPVAIALADKAELRSATDAKFSLRYCAREALLRGVPVVKSFSDDSWHSVTASPDRWSSWVDRFEVVSDRGLPTVGAHVRVRTTDGKTSARTVLAPHGSAADPMSSAEVDAKFRANCARALSEDRIEAAIAALRSLEGGDDLAGSGVIRELLPQPSSAAD